MVLDKVVDNKWEITNTTPGNNDNHYNKYTSDGVQYGYTPIDFSNLNFKEAISLNLQWSGLTLTATAHMWGKFNKTSSDTLSFQLGAGILSSAYAAFTHLYNGTMALGITDSQGNQIWTDSNLPIIVNS